jgi:xanthine dehydrogenase YagT iron-sulfur-binding subunit
MSDPRGGLPPELTCNDREKETLESVSLSPASIARRRFLLETGALTGLVATPFLATLSTDAEALTDDASRAHSGAVPLTQVQLTVNGRGYQLTLDPRVTLLDALRDHLGLTGTKKGCDRGQCGACTVMVNGRRVNSCLTLALSLDGDEVATIEGLGNAENLHPIQATFVEHDAFQCGYCTPGQICSVVALLKEVQRGDASAATPDVRRITPMALSDEEIRERMSGNLCRCGAYVNIVAAIRDIAERSI